MVVKILKKGNSIQTQAITPSVVKKGVKILKKKKPLTLRQQRVVAMVGNGGKSKAKILRKAGYSKAVVDNPSKVFDSPAVAEAISPVVAQMSRIRNKALNALEAKPLGKQSPYNLTIISNVMTKDVELLSGRPTDRTQYELPEEEQDRLRKILEKNRKK